MNAHPRRTATRIVLIYAVIAALWITFSDRAVAWFFPSLSVSTFAQTLKGLFFVLVTSGILYALARRFTEGLTNSELHLRILVQSMSRMERLRDEFLSTAAHELKTPITTIKAYSELLQQWLPNEAGTRQRTALSAINNQCERMTIQIQDLLVFSRIRLGQLEMRNAVFRMNTVVDRAVAQIRALSGGVQIRIMQNDEAYVFADQDRIKQVLVNLLSNAVRFSPALSPIEVSVLCQGRQVVVAVEDHGLGIPADKQARIFERFYQAHGQTHDWYRAGMGIGLYLSREIVRRNSGRIWFVSEEGKGSTFYFALPVAEARRQEKAA